MAGRPKQKKRLLIDIKIPDANGFRMTVTGKEGETSEEALAAWVPVCVRMQEMVTEHLEARKLARTAIRKEQEATYPATTNPIPVGT